jgi:hypothetical protein
MAKDISGNGAAVIIKLKENNNIRGDFYLQGKLQSSKQDMY